MDHASITMDNKQGTNEERKDHPKAQDIIELLDDDDDDDDDEENTVQKKPNMDGSGRKPNDTKLATDNSLRESRTGTNSKQSRRSKTIKSADNRARELQGGLVLEEDVETLVVRKKPKFQARENSSDDSDDDDEAKGKVKNAMTYIQQQEEQSLRGGKQKSELYHDPDFESAPSSIEGSKRTGKVEKYRCSPAQPVELSYISKGPNKGRPYHHCPKSKSLRCKYFRWAFQAERMHWYRFGQHTGHVVVRDQGFSADDLLQGKVGDCWFLSALAVIAERPDLIMRLFPNDTSVLNNPHGIVEVRLFLDGFWQTVTMDNFLPCMIDEKAETELQQAMDASLGQSTIIFGGTGHVLSGSLADAPKKKDPQKEEELFLWTGRGSPSSKYDPFALSDKNRQVLSDTLNLLAEHQKRPANPYAKKPPIDTSQIGQSDTISASIPKKLNRMITTEDLAYSKAKKEQLWVPFIEKAYAKAHGSYQAISGGHIAEAFLDLTGAPTKVYNLHNDPTFNPRQFWYQLLSYRRQRLPMGCGTDSSQAGIIGMHAYSILDVREIRNVGIDFFREKLSDRTLGNVSGFTEFDGTVRLLRIRNPHGRGEWQGEFSDRSGVWEKLLQHTQSDASKLERTMKNDGTFWIDYDSFLLGFSNVDVVLSFLGNHAKSFHSHFPMKLSRHRCTRAFEVSLLDVQPGVPSRDTVELYVMGIQKTRRGASHGRSDRKVSYKVSDLGILVGENADIANNSDATDDMEFSTVEGEMFGFKRNGHHRLILDRRKNKRLVVMPVSFGHPAATDKERSFALRFVADAPLLIRELPTVPRLDRVLQTFCFEPYPQLRTQQRKRKILLDDTVGLQNYGEPLYRVFQVDCLANGGGVVFVYLCVNDRLIQQKGLSRQLNLSLSISATCRGMMCRIERGFLKHETLAKGKKFEAAWRKFETSFHEESRSRLLMVLVQSGQDSEMGTVTCKCESSGKRLQGNGSPKKQATITLNGKLSSDQTADGVDNYDVFGIFTGSDITHSGQKHEAIFGQSASQGLASQPIGLDVFDIELERALALSRGDLEMKEVLDLSKQDAGPFSPTGGYHSKHPGMLSEEEQLRLAMQQSTSSGHRMDAIDVDQDLQRAIAASKGTRMETDTELAKAIELSLQQDKAAPSERNVIDIDLDEKPKGVPAAKRQKTAPKDEGAVIEIVDDDDDDEKESNNSNDIGENTDGDGNPTAKETIDEKRRLAAEAAMKRFEAKSTEQDKA